MSPEKVPNGDLGNASGRAVLLSGFPLVTDEQDVRDALQGFLIVDTIESGVVKLPRCIFIIFVCVCISYFLFIRLNGSGGIAQPMYEESSS
jgi:hypothetical protein